MRLWETYFRLWNRVSHDLSEGVTQPTEKSIKEGINSYYGYLCDKETCFESGV